MKVFLLPPPALPVPAIQGGAVETLLDHLILQNEAEGRLELVCASVPDDKAQALAHSFRHTRMIYLPPTPPRKRALWGPVCGAKRRLGQAAPLDPWYNEILKEIRRERPDFVIAEGGNLSEPAAISREIGRAHMLAHLHMQTPCSPELEPLYSGVLAISQFVADAWQCDTMHKHLIPNCVDTALFRPYTDPASRQAKRTELGFAPEDFVVMFCGRICPEKGVHKLVEALRLCPDPRVKLLVVGSPFFAAEDSSPFFEQLKADAAVLEREGRIRFTGFVPNPALPSLLQASDCACLPALWDEPAGITAIEAMACGCPVIATRSGGMPEYLAGSEAVLLDRDERIDDSEALFEVPGAEPLAPAISDALCALKADPERRARMSRAGAERAKAFSRQAYYQNFCDALECAAREQEVRT